MLLERYAVELGRLPLADNSRRAYLRYAKRYLDFLATYDADGGDPLSDPAARDYAARDFKRQLKTVERLRPATVNLALDSVASLNRFLGLGPANVQRERLPKQAPRALTEADFRRFLRACERCPSTRDRTIALLLLHAALREAECAALDVADVAITARKGVVTIRAGKGQDYREIPLNTPARKAVDAWLEQRRDLAKPDETALFVGRYGRRLSTRSIDKIVRRLGRNADLAISPHVLRHTALTRLVRARHDLVMIAEIAGHKQIETTRRYTLPSAADRAAALESIDPEH